MITSDASDSAEMLRWLEQRVSDLESRQPSEGSINELRTVSDTELSADSVSATSQASTPFTWDVDAWGFQSW